MSWFYKEMTSPVGKLKLVASDDAIVAILWEKEKLGRVRLEKMQIAKQHPLLLNAEAQLREYFLGQRKVFDFPIKAVGGTTFQTKVWKALSEIPFGVTRTYSELAKSIGSPKASRAVGAANGKNPLSIVVPCHRVIGANGSLTGFAGGLSTKEKLLTLERPKK